MNRPTPAALLAALRERALSLHHQVQVHVPSARLSGVEAFVRWPHPALGLLGPAEVVPLVEEGALHESLDPWVIGELCRQVVRWRKARVPVPLVAANVWSQTLESPAFVDLVQDALRASGAEPTMLEIELPRGSLARDDLRATLADLHERGVRLAVDDVALGGQESEQPVDTFKLPRASSGSSETVARVERVALLEGPAGERYERLRVAYSAE